MMHEFFFFPPLVSFSFYFLFTVVLWHGYYLSLLRGGFLSYLHFISDGCGFGYIVSLSFALHFLLFIFPCVKMVLWSLVFGLWSFLCWVCCN